MSYYGPNFAGIDREWYRNTDAENYQPERVALDAIWDARCDAILTRYVDKYGTFFSAYADEIMRAVDKVCGTKVRQEVRYYDYYLSNRAYELPEVRKKWISSQEEAEATFYRCPYCNIDHCLADTHPDLIRKLGIPPTRCRTCNYVVSRYRDYWDQEIDHGVQTLMRNLNTPRVCDLCDQGFSLEDAIFKYSSFGTRFVDCLYPNIFLNVCPKCFDAIFKDYRRGSKKLKLKRLRKLFEFTGEIPTSDFERFLYLYRDPGDLKELLGIFRVMRTPAGYKEEFGNFFTALVESGILPEGSRRMRIGTMVLANDGHLCLSLPEKEIDDFLFEHGVLHEKEVRYPDSKMRADWEILGQAQRVFVEYFGLMSNRAYAKKAKQKATMAKSNKIELIEIYPGDNWKDSLLRFID